ncbi:hypothetical protein L6452_21710 [Arctium lappa]|uniref:Uncharacterized protein n=1 Tax=Arctium lappa TaxID=4217 RepID=A0ACB9AYG1_ARCLA|nr:hypothetical protein L6452_21710 [Arctium lappa]
MYDAVEDFVFIIVLTSRAENMVMKETRYAMEDCYSMNEIYVNDVVVSSNALHVEDMAVVVVNCVDSLGKCLSGVEDTSGPSYRLVNDSVAIVFSFLLYDLSSFVPASSLSEILLILFNDVEPSVHEAMHIDACILAKM